MTTPSRAARDRPASGGLGEALGPVDVAVFDGSVRLERLELPDRRPGEVDVAIDAAAICGSDLHTVLGRRSAPPRVALGHEGVGRVVAIDPDTLDLTGARLEPGDRVVFGLFHACSRCDRCRAGLEMKCRSLVKYGHESVATPPHATGTLATGVRLLPGVPVLRVPDDLTDARVVSAGCAVATAAAIVEAAGALQPDMPALVMGAGAVGVYSAAMLLSAGCRVDVVEPDPERHETVRRLGANPIDPSAAESGDTSGGGKAETLYPVVVEASGADVAFTTGLERTEIGGRLVAAGSVSPGATRATIDPARIVIGRVTIVGVHNYTSANLAAGLEWLAWHVDAVRPERLLSPAMPLTDIADAFDLMATGRHPRVLIRPAFFDQ